MKKLIPLTSLLALLLASCNLVATPNNTATIEGTQTTSQGQSSVTPIESHTINENSNNLNITTIKGGNECAYIEFECPTGDSVNNYSISYKKSTDTSYTVLDSKLVRKKNNTIRADILGISPSYYSIKITKNNANTIIDKVYVSAQDRSGYAHFGNTDGIGAYKNDGTLKDNAIVVYVSNANKNTVKATINGVEYEGLANILKAQDTSVNENIINRPLDIRVLDTVDAATWKPITTSSYSTATTSTIRGLNGEYLALQEYSEEAIISGGFNELNEETYTKLNGLTNKIKYDSSKNEFDSYYNMLDVKNTKNITVEGVGDDAGLFQWGFTWKNTSSVEVKNLTFKDYPEDACSAEGSEEATTISGFKTSGIWIHNNTFYKGKNYFDVCSEQDKHDGDGTVDFKRLKNVTVSYNHFIKNHKTGLVGGSDTQKTANLTFHHNFYDECQSRLPFARQANMHMYNNYYYKSSGNNMQFYAGAYAFIENCYFENVKNTFSLKTSDGKAAAVKSYNNIYDNTSSSGATIVTDRLASVSNGNLYGSSFDTNSDLFYFDSGANKSDVSNLLDTIDVKDLVPLYAGAGESYYKNYGYNSSTETTKYTVTFKNGTDTFKTVSVKENNKVNEPTSYPDKSNMVFDYWSYNNSKFDFNTPITSDITLTAVFKTTPTYNSLKNSNNILVDYDFSNTTDSEKLPQLSDYTTKGIFGNNNNTESPNYTDAYAIYSNGKVKTVDNDEKGGAQIIVNTGGVHTSGIIKGYLDLTVGSNTGTKWGVLQICSNTERLIQIGATDNSSKVWGYTLDGTTFTDFSNTLQFKSGSYSIYYELDLDNGLITLIINNVTYLNKANLGIKSFSSILSMTNNKGTGTSAREITLDNIIIVKEN